MDYIKINPADNVAVALQDLTKGAVVEGVTLSMDIPRGHKIVLHDLKAGEQFQSDFCFLGYNAHASPHDPCRSV